MRIFRKYHDTRLGFHIALLTDFRRVCKIAESDYYLRHVCLPARPHGTTRLPLDGFS